MLAADNHHNNGNIKIGRLPAHDELRTCRTSLASPEQPVLIITTTARIAFAQDQFLIQAAAIHMIAGRLTVKAGPHTGSYSGQIKTDKNRKERTTPSGVNLMRS